MKYFLLVLLFPLLGTAQILRPNLIINGDAVLDQRGSTAAPITCGSGATYGPDRFACTENAATGVSTITRGTLTSTDAPYTLGMRYTSKITATTGFTYGATEYNRMVYSIEGNDIAQIAKKTVTLSFWVRSKKTGAACIAAGNSIGDRVFIKQYTIASADTWQEVSIPINLATGSASGTWDYGTGLGLYIRMATGFGTDFDDASDNTWVNTNEYGTTACQTNNLFASNADYMEFTGIRLTEGAQKVPFVRAGGGSYAAELALANRYTRCFGRMLMGGFNGVWRSVVQLIPEMRAAPTSIFISGGGNLTGLDCGGSSGNLYIGNMTTNSLVTCTAGTGAITLSGAISSTNRNANIDFNGTSISGTNGDIAWQAGVFAKDICVSAEL